MYIQKINRALEKQADLNWKRRLIEWNKQYNEVSKAHGVLTPSVRKLSAEYFAIVKSKTKNDILQICEELLETGYIEERIIAFDWAFRLKRQYVSLDFLVFESWLKKYVHDWGSCDDLCTHVFGAFIFKFPEHVSDVEKWAESANRWTRRACAVVMIFSIRRKQELDRVFEIADLLLTDTDVMVQKGYGWMLKEASNKYPKEVFNYVMQHKKEMPRTALRYAVEKLPLRLKKEAMER